MQWRVKTTGVIEDLGCGDRERPCFAHQHRHWAGAAKRYEFQRRVVFPVKIGKYQLTATAFVQQVYNNRNMFRWQNEGQTFYPVKAATALVRRFSRFYLAILNFDDKRARTVTVPLSRIDRPLVPFKSQMLPLASRMAPRMEQQHSVTTCGIEIARIGPGTVVAPELRA